VTQSFNVKVVRVCAQFDQADELAVGNVRRAQLKTARQQAHAALVPRNYEVHTAGVRMLWLCVVIMSVLISCRFIGDYRTALLVWDSLR
jgi:hypothetical protein